MQTVNVLILFSSFKFHMSVLIFYGSNTNGMCISTVHGTYVHIVGTFLSWAFFFIFQVLSSICKYGFNVSVYRSCEHNKMHSDKPKCKTC